MNRIFFILIALFLGNFSANAQKYVADLLFSTDSASVYKIARSEKSSSEVPGVRVYGIPNGETVTLTRTLDGNPNIGAFTKGGEEYCIHGADLVFSEENPESTVNLFPDLRKEGRHTASERFFTTMTPYCIIALLFIAAIALAFLGRSEPFRRVALTGMPLCILLASVLEIWGYALIGTTVFWWCNYDTYGFFGSLFRAIPYVIFVAFQVYSIKLYEQILFADDPDREISVKPMAVSLGMCIPATVAAAILCACFWRSATDWISLIVFLLTLGIGTVVSYRRNVEAAGVFNGTMLTVFTAVYIIGGLIAVWGLIVVIFRLILQILMIIAGIIMIAAVGTRRYKDQYGNKYEEDGFGNIHRIN